MVHREKEQRARPPIVEVPEALRRAHHLALFGVGQVAQEDFGNESIGNTKKMKITDLMEIKVKIKITTREENEEGEVHQGSDYSSYFPNLFATGVLHGI